MTKNDLKGLIERGELVDCTAIEYNNTYRRWLQELAGEYIDDSQIVKSMIAMNEVKRLDEKLGVSL